MGYWCPFSQASLGHSLNNRKQQVWHIFNGFDDLGSPGILCSFYSGKHLQHAEMPQSCSLLSSAMNLTFPYQFLSTVNSMRALTRQNKCQHTWLQSRHLSWMLLLRDCSSLICCTVNEWHVCKFNLCFMLLLISLSHKEFILCSWWALFLTRSEHSFLSLPQSMHTQCRNKRNTLMVSPWAISRDQAAKRAVSLSCLHSCWAGTGRAQIHMCLPGKHCAHTKTPQKLKLCQRETQGFSQYLRWGLILAIVCRF